MFDYDTSPPDFQQFMDEEWQSYLTDFDVKTGDEVRLLLLINQNYDRPSTNLR